MMDMNLQGGQQGGNSMPDWLMKALGIGGGLGTAAGGAWNMFGGGQKNPADAANKTIGQIPGQTQPYYQPYMDAGKGAMGNLQNQYKDLLSGNTQNQLGASYKESPGYQAALKAALGAGNNAAAAGGMLGTPAHEAQNMGIASDEASKDYENYIKNQMGLYGAGLSGNEGLNAQGFQANQDYANTLANTLGQQGAYQFAGQAGKNASNAQGMGNIFSGLGMAAGSLFGGPAGGAAGGAAGNWFSKLFGG